MKKKIHLIIFSFCLFTNIFAQATVEEIAGETFDTSNFLSAGDFQSSVQLAMTNNDYLVTAGDVYQLTYAANGSPIEFTITVDATYKLKISTLAVLDAKGKTYIELKKQVEEIVSKNYPLSAAQFVLLNPSNFKVTIKGEAKSTAERNAWALSRLSSVIGSSFTPYTSTRNITVVSLDGKERNYDLYKAIREGDLSQNPYIRPGDVIILNRYDRKVSIYGSVERPGVYELLPDENLVELIKKYGNGLTEFANTELFELNRRLDVENKDGLKIYLTQSDFENNYKLLNCDSVFIPSYETLKPVMTIMGAVGALSSDISLQSSNKISKQFEKGTEYAFFIRSNKDLFSSSQADLKESYVERKGQRIPLDIEQVFFDKTYDTQIQIKPNDVLVVPFKQLFVTVAGSVYKPGRYPYIPDRTYDYYVAMAGGYIKTQNFNKAVLIEDRFGNKLNKKTFIEPETIITVKTNSFTYYFNQYGTTITAICTLVTTIFNTWLLIKKL